MGMMTKSLISVVKKKKSHGATLGAIPNLDHLQQSLLDISLHNLDTTLRSDEISFSKQQKNK